MTDERQAGLLMRLLPDIPGSRLLLIGAGGIGLAAAELARDLGVTIVVANRSQPKLDALKAAMPDVATHLIDARSQESVNQVLDAAQPDHILLATGRVFGATAGSVELAKAMDYFGDRLEPIIAIANWIANSARKPRSFTIVSGFIGVPTMGNMTWSAMGVAVKGLVEHLAVELGPVRVNAVAPGPVLDTRMCRDVVGDAGVAVMAAGLTKQLPIGRPVVAGDVARQILFVVGDPIATGSVRFTEGGLALVPSSILRDAHIEDQGH
jgi:NAD(P)-dependent dehydrogenase (short-subunit alcohol dehydrogenase family)